ncbi:MAG: mycofactocin-coupled SDR family oxidoreductase [bacterium]|nr:mycofactocin-coupled SDR family oxidoreductase [bacterium]
MSGRVAGKVAVVTGAGRGQGRSHAVVLASEGADVVVLDACTEYDTIGYSMATEEDLHETARQVEQLGQRAVAIKVDVRDRANLQNAIDEAVQKLGRLDIVVANAGVCSWQTWDNTSEELWRDTLDVNLTGAWNTMTAGAKHLIAAGGGSIIAISSTAGSKGLPFLAPYVASKHGLVGVANALANELAIHHIRVNTVHPAGVNTPLITQNRGSLEPMIANNPDLGPVFMNALPVDLLESIDVSNAVLYLASDESRYVTGLQLKVDAGAANR